MSLAQKVMGVAQWVMSLAQWVMSVAQWVMGECSSMVDGCSSLISTTERCVRGVIFKVKITASWQKILFSHKVLYQTPQKMCFFSFNLTFHTKRGKG